MLDRDKIKTLLDALNVELIKVDVKGEIGVVGGSAMCIAFGSRRSTKDVDAIFAPSQIIRDAAIVVAQRYNQPDDWLNDGVKGYLSDVQPKKNIVYRFSNLIVWAPEPEYILAMKIMSARLDSKDADDIQFLLKYLKIDNTNDVISKVDHYFPNKQPPARIRYMLDDIFSEM